MKRNHKVYLRITIFLILLYVGLLFVLYLSEHAHSAAAIKRPAYLILVQMKKYTHRIRLCALP